MALASGTGEDVAALMSTSARMRWRLSRRTGSAILAAFALAVIGVWAWNAWQVPAHELLVDDDAAGEAVSVASPSASDAARGVTAYISGAVPSPGVYSAPAGARVHVFVDLAGGLDDEADTSAVNLAAPVTDGSHIVVPRLGEQSEEPGMINLNTADVDELDDLPGIGPALAEAIVAWREENGPFTAIEDLLNVPGIGESKLEDVRDRVVI